MCRVGFTPRRDDMETGHRRHLLPSKSPRRGDRVLIHTQSRLTVVAGTPRLEGRKSRSSRTGLERPPGTTVSDLTRRTWENRNTPST